MAQLKYRIANIKEKRFFINEDHNLSVSTIRSETTYAIDINTYFDVSKGLMSIGFDFKLLLRHEKETILMQYVASMEYEVIGHDISADNIESMNLPIEIVSMMVSSTYSTFRGIIYSRCGNSILRESIVPLTNPSFFLDKVSTINETEQRSTPSES